MNGKALPAESGWYLRDLESYGRLGSGLQSRERPV